MRITLPNPKRFSKIFQAITDISLATPVLGISTDSRECLKGDLYIAIMGENVDGNDFIDEAHADGAVAALTVKAFNSSSPFQNIQVDDPVKTIGKVANTWRNQFDIPVLGITGSNGKTTTKELIKHILGSKYSVFATKGNFNTSIGVPLTLLQLQSNHNFCVIEMGANQTGDIKTLCEIINPTNGLITNVAPAHLEGFGNIQNVAKEKAELFNYLYNGIVFKNISDELVNNFTTNTKTVTYGCAAESDFCADYYREEDGNIILIINANEINIKSQSIVFAKNILAATTVANSFGIDWNTIREKVLSFTPTYGRNVLSKYGDITVIDDTYNANYNSTQAAIEYLADYQSEGRKIFVFGDMAELGRSSKKYHKKIGEKCLEKKLDAVFTVGKETFNTNAIFDSTIINKHFSNKEQLVKELCNFVKSEDVVLFKGSRSMEMEKIIQEVFRK